MPRLPRLAVPVFAALWPSALILCVLVLLEALSPATALLLLPVATLAVLASLRLYLGDLDGVVRYAQRLTEESDAATLPAPAPARGRARRLTGAVAQLNRTWRQRHRQAVRRAEQSETVLAALQDPLLLVDAGRRVLRVNLAAERLLGAQIVGRDVAAGLRDPRVLQAVDGALAGAHPPDAEFSLPGQVERVFEVHVASFVRPAGLPPPADPDRVEAAAPDGVAAVITLHDVTAIRRSEQMRADFVANASHELRTPLASLLGFVETLQGPARDDAPARERFLEIMREQAMRMSRLIADLLSLSRIEMDEHTPPIGSVAPAALLATVLSTLEMRAADRSVTLTLVAPDDVPPITADADQITQVFQNLVDNAIKYTRPRTVVTVGVAAVAAAGTAPAGINVSVSDQGEGIPREHLPRLTERFYRVDPARSRQLGGTGLGLAIVKHIVNRHRGRLSVASEPGQGTVFSVFLPLDPTDGDATSTAPARKVPAAARTVTRQ